MYVPPAGIKVAFELYHTYVCMVATAQLQVHTHVMIDRTLLAS